MIQFAKLSARHAALAAILVLAAACGAPEQVSAPPEDQTAAAAPADAPAPGSYDFPHDVSDLDVDPDVRYGRLENGMRYAIRQNATPPDTAVVRMAINAGSLAEADDQRGLAHFVEHMAFNGSENVPEGEMVPMLERYGLQFGPDTNAGTSFEYVIYMLNLPGTDEEIVDTALFLMRETASNLLLEDSAIDAERGVILSEERFRNTPIRRWQNALSEFSYPDTLIPVRDAIGTVEVIETAGRDRFVDYYENYYTPDRTMLVVVGDIDIDEIEAKIAETFGDWEQPEDARGGPDLGEIDANRPFATGYFHDPELYTILTVRTLRPGARSVDTVQSRYDDVLNALGNGILQRRLQTIINAGDSPFIQANAGYSRDTFGIAEQANLFAVAVPERWDEALTVLEQELRRAREHGFTRAELDEQLANMHRALRDAAAQANTRQSRNLADQLWASWRYESVVTHPSYDLSLFESRRDSVSPEAVHAAFRAQWDNAEPQIFLGTSVEIDDAEAAIADVWRASAAEPVEPVEEGEASEFAYTDFGQPGEVVERVEIEDFGLVQLVFSNGVRATLKQTDFEDDVIRAAVTFGRGELEPRREPVVDSVAAGSFVLSGLEAHSADEMQRILAGRTVGVGFGVGNDAFRFSARTTPADLHLQMQVFAAYLTHPGWREEGLSRYRAAMPETRRNLRSTPSGVLQLEGARLLRSGDQRYGFPTQEEADAVDMEEIRHFLEPAFTSAPLEITLVGDFDEAAVIQAIASTLGALPQRDETWPARDEARTIVFPDPAPEPVILRHAGQDYQSMVNIYWPTTDDSDVREVRALRLLRGVFNLKLIEVLREREGFTYSAFNTNFESGVYPDYGYLWVGVDIRPENIDAVYDIIAELAADLAAGEISEDELLRARRPLLEQLRIAQENNNAWLNWLTQTQEKPERLDRLRTMISDYESITREEVLAVAETYLTPESAWRMTILPAALDGE